LSTVVLRKVEVSLSVKAIEIGNKKLYFEHARIHRGGTCVDSAVTVTARALLISL
jgi:hypothetical protein